jgi:hypothetical protein
MSAAHAADEAKDESASKPKSAPKTMSEPESATALVEFKVACDHWLPLLNERDQDQASTHANSMFEKLKNSRSSPGGSGMTDRSDAAIDRHHGVVDRTSTRQSVIAVDERTLLPWSHITQITNESVSDL